MVGAHITLVLGLADEASGGKRGAQVLQDGCWRGEASAGVEPASAVLQTAARPSGSGAAGGCPRQELNLVYDLRTVACGFRHTPRTAQFGSDPPPGSRARPCGFEGRRAS